MAQSFELADAAPWGQGEVRRGSLFVFNDFREKDFGSRGQAATGHLLCIAHQFVEVDLWSRNECADALAAFDDAFALERGERMACCHQAYLVNPCQVSFRSNYVPREQLPRLDALAEVAWILWKAGKPFRFLDGIFSPESVGQRGPLVMVHRPCGERIPRPRKYKVNPSPFSPKQIDSYQGPRMHLSRGQGRPPRVTQYSPTNCYGALCAFFYKLEVFLL